MMETMENRVGNRALMTQVRVWGGGLLTSQEASGLGQL